MPEQTGIPLPVQRHRPYELVMLGRVVGDLERAAMAIMDDAPSLAHQLEFLALAKAELARLGQTVAAVESVIARTMPRTRYTDPVRGVTATASAAYKYTWDVRRLLFDVVVAKRVQDVAEYAASYEEGLDDEEVRAQAAQDARSDPGLIAEAWDLVDLMIRLGRWDPRSTALQEEFGWTKEDVSGYRKAEKGRTTVKVELDSAKGENDGDGDGEPASDGTETGPVGPGETDVREGEGGAQGPEDA